MALLCTLEMPDLDTESCTLEVTAIITERASWQVRQGFVPHLIAR